MGERKQGRDVRLASHVLHRNLGVMPVAGHGLSSRIAVDNEKYPPFIDLSSGAGISCLGHSCTSVKDAMTYQLDRLPYVHSGTWTTDVCEDFAEKLIERSGIGGTVVFLNGGGEAVEAACKLAMQYFSEQGYDRVPQFIAREHSYHGNSLFCLALGDHPRKKDYPEFNMVPVYHMPAYRPLYHNSPVSYIVECTDQLRQDLKEAQAIGRPAIVVIEPIGGTTLGIAPSTYAYLKHVRELCTKYNALLIYDEVLCGNFRTGKLFAWQYYQEEDKSFSIAPDIIVTGKGLTAGYFPLSAVIVGGRITSALRTGHSGRLWHSTTNQNHPLGCAAALAAFKEYDLVTPAQQFRIHSALKRRVDDLKPWCVSWHGEGALWGLHLDPGIPGLHKKAKSMLFDIGVACYSDGGTIDGRGNFLMIAPPLTIRMELLHEGIDKLADVICKLSKSTPVLNKEKGTTL